MTKSEIIVLRGPNDWTMGLSFDGLQVEFRWRELSYDGRSIDHWGKLVDPETGESIRFEQGKDWQEQAIRNAVAAFRVAQLREELQLANSIPFMTDEEVRKSTVLDLFERSERGEYLGQLSTHQFFYVQNLAAILDMDMHRALEIVDRLVAEGKLGLNGMILIPHEQQEDGFRHWEKQTGHRRLSMGDFGNWSCSACGSWGDERDDPKAVACERTAPGWKQ